MKKIAVIGAGISGAACARLLKTRGYDVTIFESGSSAGGLVKCTRGGGNLFHRVGGHVFNAKDLKVSDWFWSHFDRDREFLFSRRNAKIFMGDRFVGYPIENHIFQLEANVADRVIGELLDALKHQQVRDSSAGLSFLDFLLDTFGPSLCEMYFIPYNKKIWRSNLAAMPIEWLDGKLPMPKLYETIRANILRKEETSMVHAQFYYPRQGGSQFIIDRLIENANIRLNTPIDKIRVQDEITINGELFSAAVFTGDIRKIAHIMNSEDVRLTCLSGLRSNGTTTVLCLADANPYSWVYIPDNSISCHRIIMTGNFAPSNNSETLKAERVSCTVEFVGEVTKDEIDTMIGKLPFNLSVIDTNYEPNSYIIQSEKSRVQVNDAKKLLSEHNLWLCGRFAEWEYYNMDAAIAAAMRTVDSIHAVLESTR